jgi:hypothetical protein
MNYINFDYSYENDKFNITYKPIQRKYLTWGEEIDNTAISIVNSTNKPLFVCLSGGIDGEVVALSMLKNKIPFTALIVRHKSGANYHDIVYAQDFCKKHHINTLTVWIDEKEFFSTGINKYLKEGYQATTLFKYMQIFMFETVEKLGGCAIICGGEPIFYTVNDEICIDRGLGYVPAIDWCKKNNTLHYVCFYEQNPEIYASYLNESLVNLLLKNPDYFRGDYNNRSIEKAMLHHKYWPQMERRSKFTGFENIYQLKVKSNTRLRGIFPHIQPNWIPVNTIKKQLNINVL